MNRWIGKSLCFFIHFAKKQRWLVFNKTDVLGKEESTKKAAEIVERLGWKDKYYLISAVNQEGIKPLCWDLMAYINENPREHVEQVKEKIEFMWDDYHQQAIEEAFKDDDFDDWDEADEEGVETFYEK